MGDKHEKAYGQGVKDAENASALDEFLHNNFGKSLSITRTDQSYDKGWEDQKAGKVSSKDKK
jgi:hypothetical protein